jgi:hypothetical protein
MRKMMADVFVINRPSDYRKRGLKKMLQDMKGYGKVIRIPIHPDFFELEKAF